MISRLKYSSADSLTPDELDRSKRADYGGYGYEAVTPADVFGTASSSRLASEIRSTNPRRYQHLKRAYVQQLVEIPMPLPTV
jgi:hypothetical protein